MKYWIKFLVCVSFSPVCHAVTPVDIANTILNSDEPVKIAAQTFHKVKPFSELAAYIAKYGKITESNCFLNHDSKLFDTVTCQVKHSQLFNGAVWEFYFFLDNDKWVGTNLTFVQNLPQNTCLSNVQVKNGIGLGLKFTESQC